MGVYQTSDAPLRSASLTGQCRLQDQCQDKDSIAKESTGRDWWPQESCKRCLVICTLFPVCYLTCYHSVKNGYAGKHLLPTKPPVERATSHQEAERIQQGEAKSCQAIAGETGCLTGTLAAFEVCWQASLQSNNSQWDESAWPAVHAYWYVIWNHYEYVLSRIDISSRFKVLRPMKAKHVKDVASMISNIYKVGPLTSPKVFQCDNRNEFKAGVTKLL